MYKKKQLLAMCQILQESPFTSLWGLTPLTKF